MTTATSLILMAVGAILAFAVSFQAADINIQTIGVILIVVGGLGLVISVATLPATRRGDPDGAVLPRLLATSVLL